MKRLFASTWLIILVAIGSQPVQAAAIIDFEAFEAFGNPPLPMPEGTLISSVKREGVIVTFTTRDDTGTYIPTLTKVGAPFVAFRSPLPFDDDTPVDSAGDRYLQGGDFSLTDGTRVTRDYIIEFSSPVENLSLDLYDFNSDGPRRLGDPGVDAITFEAYDALGYLLASIPVTSPNPRVDGNVMQLAMNFGNISKAVLDFGSLVERGTAIDNIQFTPFNIPEASLPEPAGLTLAGLSLFGLVLRRRRRG